MKRVVIPKDIRALLPVERIVTRVERDAEARSRRAVLLVVAATGWLFFTLSLVITGCR